MPNAQVYVCSQYLRREEVQLLPKPGQNASCECIWSGERAMVIRLDYKFAPYVIAACVFFTTSATLGTIVLMTGYLTRDQQQQKPAVILTMTVEPVSLSFVAQSRTLLVHNWRHMLLKFVAQTAWTSKQMSRHYILYHSSHPGWYSYFPGYLGSTYFPGCG